MIMSSPRYRTPGRAVGVLAVAAERAGRRELTQLVTDHVLGDKDRNVMAAVMDRDGVTDHPRKDR